MVMSLKVHTEQDSINEWAFQCYQNSYLTYLTQDGSQAPIPSTGVCQDPCFSLEGTLSTVDELGKNAALTRSAYDDVTSCIIS